MALKEFVGCDCCGKFFEDLNVEAENVRKLTVTDGNGVMLDSVTLCLGCAPGAGIDNTTRSLSY